MDEERLDVLEPLLERKPVVGRIHRPVAGLIFIRVFILLPIAGSPVRPFAGSSRSGAMPSHHDPPGHTARPSGARRRTTSFGQRGG